MPHLALLGDLESEVDVHTTSAFHWSRDQRALLLDLADVNARLALDPGTLSQSVWATSIRERDRLRQQLRDLDNDGEELHRRVTAFIQNVKGLEDICGNPQQAQEFAPPSPLVAQPFVAQQEITPSTPQPGNPLSSVGLRPLYAIDSHRRILSDLRVKAEATLLMLDFYPGSSEILHSLIFNRSISQ